MATTRKATASTRKAQTKVSSEKATEIIEDVKKPIKAAEVDMNQYISVKNGFPGMLIYKSSRTGERFVWDAIGDEQEMELRELKNAKNSDKEFFTNNWFMFDEEDSWVIDFLGVRQFYKNAVSIEEFDNIFVKSPDEIRKILSSMTDGQKRSASFRARLLIDDGTIDSRNAIKAIEETLDVKLTAED